MIRLADAFKLLELPETAAPSEIRMAWRSAAKSAHPDNPRTGNPEAFRELQKAFEIIYDYAINTPCPNCKSKGYVREFRGFSGVEIICSPCSGTGKKWDAEKER